MSLSCVCYEADDAIKWFYERPKDYTTAPSKPVRRRRCCSCRTLIQHDAICAKFKRWRSPRDIVENIIHGEYGEIALAPYWMCETCADLYFSLDELGFCIDIAESMKTLVMEYAAINNQSHQSAGNFS